MAEFADTVDPDKTAHNEQSHLDLQSLPSSLRIFNTIQFIYKVFPKFANIILLSAFLVALLVQVFSRVRNCFLVI